MSELETREALAKAAAELGFLANLPLFFGAGVLELYLDRPEVIDPAYRPTEDIEFEGTGLIGTVSIFDGDESGFTAERLEF